MPAKHKGKPNLIAVVEISSSPDPEAVPGPSRKRPRPTPKARLQPQPHPSLGGSSSTSPSPPASRHSLSNGAVGGSGGKGRPATTNGKSKGKGKARARPPPSPSSVIEISDTESAESDVEARIYVPVYDVDHDSEESPPKRRKTRSNKPVASGSTSKTSDTTANGKLRGKGKAKAKPLRRAGTPLFLANDEDDDDDEDPLHASDSPSRKQPREEEDKHTGPVYDVDNDSDADDDESPRRRVKKRTGDALASGSNSKSPTNGKSKGKGRADPLRHAGTPGSEDEHGRSQSAPIQEDDLDDMADFYVSEDEVEVQVREGNRGGAADLDELPRRDAGEPRIADDLPFALDEYSGWAEWLDPPHPMVAPRVNLDETNDAARIEVGNEEEVEEVEVRSRRGGFVQVHAPPPLQHPQLAAVLAQPPAQQETKDAEAEGEAPDPTLQILEVIPDIEHGYLAALIEEHLPTYGPVQVVEFIIQTVLENGYPKEEEAGGSKAKGKRKASEETDGGRETKRRRLSEKKRLGNDASLDEIGAALVEEIEDPENFVTNPAANERTNDYAALAIQQLSQDFGYVPVSYVRQAFGGGDDGGEGRGGYARTWVWLSVLEGRGEGAVLPYTRKVVPTPPERGKGKKRALWDGLFEREREWVGQRAEAMRRVLREMFGTDELPHDKDTGAGDSSSSDSDDGPDEIPQEDEDYDPTDPSLIECGCCFGSYPFERMAQCPEGHLFCRGCVYNHSKTLLGGMNAKIGCMHIGSSTTTTAAAAGSSSEGGCSTLFSESELKRLLPKKLYKLYERTKQQQELNEADIEGLERCPFCEYMCVVEVDVEVDKLFRCGNRKCGKISCRVCKREEHTPKSCKEMDADKHLNKRIMIEEAMTKALMRNCPKCSNPFIKEGGCNKMTCTKCHTLSCYVCRKVIKGYDHFHQNDPRQPGGSSHNTKCPLWDSVDQRHDEEVKKAYAEMVAHVKKDNPDIKIGEDIKVDLPAPPPANPHGGGYPEGYIHPGMFARDAGLFEPAMMHYRLDPRPAPHLPLPARYNVDGLRRQVQVDQERRARVAGRLAQAELTLPGARAREEVARQRLRDLQAELLIFGGGGAGASSRGRRDRDRNPSRAAIQADITQAKSDVRKEAIERAANEMRVETFQTDLHEIDARLEEHQRRIREGERQGREWRERQLAEWEARERERIRQQERVRERDLARVLEREREREERLALNLDLIDRLGRWRGQGAGAGAGNAPQGPPQPPALPPRPGQELRRQGAVVIPAHMNLLHQANAFLQAGLPLPPPPPVVPAAGAGAFGLPRVADAGPFLAGDVGGVRRGIHGNRVARGLEDLRGLNPPRPPPPAPVRVQPRRTKAARKAAAKKRT